MIDVINKKIHKNGKQIIDSINKKRIKLPNTVRISLIGFFLIVLLFSLFTINATYSQSEFSEKSVNVLSYSQQGYFDYSAYLKNNTVYQDKTFLKPGEGVLFSQIVDSIELNFTYSFNVDKSSIIKGYYEIYAQLQTDLYNKTYIIFPNTHFNKTGFYYKFYENFPSDFRFYENVSQEIDEETGITSFNPILKITCFIRILASSNNNIIYDSFSQSIELTLNQKTIEITDELYLKNSGKKTDKQEVFNKEVIYERNIWTQNSFLFIGLIFGVIIFTRSDKEKMGQFEKKINKINKKYGEWIVEVENEPIKPSGFYNIYTKSFEDLLKISEELGKLIIHHELGNIHTYLVYDDKTQYQHTMKTNTIVAKKVCYI